MTTVVEEPTARRGRPALRRALIAILFVVLAGTVVWQQTHASASAASRPVPQNAAMEDALGVRFSQVTVVGDGGLVEVRYVVLDSEKATRFQSDTTHPPRLKDEATGATAWRTALMKQGHTLRTGQTYFVIYENPKSAIKSGGTIEIDAGSDRLQHLPVM